MHSHCRIEKLFNGFGWMLVTIDDIPAGQTLPKLCGQLCLFRTRYSIETQYGHVEDPIYSFMNHSFNPTAHVAPNGEITTLTALKAGQEITSNYNQHETAISFPFEDFETGKIVH